MAQFKVVDEAHQFRIEIDGRLAGEVVAEVKNLWESALLERSPRTFTMDITRLSGYDSGGSKLLREMQNHGTCLAARTARALALLSEISSPKTIGPTLVYSADRESRQESTSKYPPKQSAKVRAAASGE